MKIQNLSKWWCVNMISKETFVNIMKRLETLDKNMEAVDVALTNLSPDFCA